MTPGAEKAASESLPKRSSAMRNIFWRVLDHLMPDGPPIFLAAVIGFLLMTIATILLR
jgi:hypothetical protein